MATVNKDFRIKNGLVVEGSTATVNGSNVLTEDSVEFLQDTTADMLVNGAQSGITFTYNDSTGVIDASVSSTPTFADHILFEGATVDSYETTLQVADPTADRTITLPDADGTVALTSDIPSLSGYVTEDGTATLTNKTISGSNNTISNIGNSSLTNSSVTINSNSLSLGDSLTLDTDDISEGATNKYYSDSAVKNVLTNSTQTNIVIEEIGGVLHITAENGVADSTTDDLEEGTVNKYYSNGLVDGHLSGGDGISYSSGTISADLKASGGLTIDSAQIAVDRTTVDGWYDASGAASGVQDNLDDHTGASSAHGVSGDIVGTSDTQSLSNKTFLGQTNFQSGGGAGGTANHIDVNGTTGDMTITSGYALNVTSSNDLTITSEGGDIVLNPDGGAYIGSVSAGNTIATNSYVDNAVSGLTWKDAVHVLADSNIALTGSTPLSIDNHTVANGYRVLLKAQSTGSQNGIYDVAISGGSYALTRSSDADAYGELIGAAAFVMEGDVYGQTSWVQSNHYLTDFTAQSWTQFSGTGSVVAGTGITVDGLIVSVDRTTVDTWYDGAGEASSQVGTHAALTSTHGVDGDIVGTTDTQTLTNKTLTSPEIATILNGAATLTLPSSTGTIALTSDIPTLDTDDVSEGTTNKYFTTQRVKDVLTGSTQTNIVIEEVGGNLVITAENGVADSTTDDLEEGTNNHYFTDERAQDAVGLNVGTGLTYNDTSGAISVTENTYDAYGAASTAESNANGYTDTAIANGDAEASPAYAAITLTDALVGTATQSLTDGSATVVDSWSTASYSGAKYLVQMKKGTDIEIIEVLVAVDGNNNVYVTEYADVISNTQLGTTDANYSGGNVRLLVTASNGTVVKVQKTLIEA